MTGFKTFKNATFDDAWSPNSHFKFITKDRAFKHAPGMLSCWNYSPSFKFNHL